MKATLSLLPLISAVLAEIHVDVEQFSNLRARDVMAMEPGPHAGVEVTPNPAMLFRRQSGCPSGYFACPNGLWCAPTGGVCCSDYGACYADEACCGSGCMPEGAECCSNGEYCPEGNICVLETSKLTGTQRMVCCTDLQCTAYVDDGITLTRTATDDVGGGVTTTAPPTTTTNVVTAMETYRVTFTWTYYFYFWTYIEYSLITSTLTTTRTTFTITATDDAAATASVEEIESTIEFSPPAEQSSLSALADETTFGPTSTPTDDSGSDETTTSSSSTATNSFVGVGGDGDNSAPGVWLDKLMVAVGLIAAMGAGALLL